MPLLSSPTLLSFPLSDMVPDSSWIPSGKAARYDIDHITCICSYISYICSRLNPTRFATLITISSCEKKACCEYFFLLNIVQTLALMFVYYSFFQPLLTLSELSYDFIATGYPLYKQAQVM